MKRAFWTMVIFAILINKICLAEIIKFDDGTLFEGQRISNNEFEVEGGYIKIFPNTIWKVVSIEERKLTDDENKNIVLFKMNDYDVTFNEKGDYSSPLTSFELNLGKRLQSVFDMYSNLSEKSCIEKVAEEFNLPPIVIDQIFLKAALEAGGKL